MRGDVALDDFAMSPQCFGIGGKFGITYVTSLRPLSICLSHV